MASLEPLILRLGDPGSHGGEVCSSALRSYAEGILIARVGDTYCCPIHDPNPIASGCIRTYVEDQLCAKNGSVASCGATLYATATRTLVEDPIEGATAAWDTFTPVSLTGGSKLWLPRQLVWS